MSDAQILPKGPADELEAEASVETETETPSEPESAPEESAPEEKPGLSERTLLELELTRARLAHSKAAAAIDTTGEDLMEANRALESSEVWQRFQQAKQRGAQCQAEYQAAAERVKRLTEDLAKL